MSTFQAEPFNLGQGNNVYAQLIATNQFGDSLQSDVGNAAAIALVPNAPQNLQNDPAVTSYLVIGLTWDAPNDDGGDPVIDYEVYFAREGSFTFELLESGVLTQTFTTTQPLVTGVTYQFFVKARNSVGVGAMSNTVSILLAQIPEAPYNVQTVLIDDQVQITWAASQEGGSAITGYQIFIRASDNTNFYEELTYCDGSDSTIIEDSMCNIPKTVLTQSPYNLAWGTSLYARVIAINAVGQSTVSDQGNDA